MTMVVMPMMMLIHADDAADATHPPTGLPVTHPTLHPHHTDRTTALMASTCAGVATRGQAESRNVFVVGRGLCSDVGLRGGWPGDGTPVRQMTRAAAAAAAAAIAAAAALEAAPIAAAAAAAAAAAHHQSSHQQQHHRHRQVQRFRQRCFQVYPFGAGCPSGMAND